ncbi:MAG: choice-of-anchor D domain-containing protein [Polyangiaceae bacterium]|nr:choice-of-anchor D domain-containing protein [Polyangiaceae bacterium]MCB9609188.1 choice-of-anchor D domain-containing protein [Polyangiaceae bacterium]
MKHLACTLATSGLLLFSSQAFAQDGGMPDGSADGGPQLDPGEVLAMYCEDVELDCTTAPLHYDKTIDLPFAFDWDTGWIPNGSDLQVRFFVKVPAETRVALDGNLQTEWPPALRHLTPGLRNGGYLSFDYGLEVGAEAKFDVSVLGVHVKWQGDIPFIPQVDFHLQRQKTFDSWAFDGSPPAQAFTDEFRLLEVNLAGLAGIPSQLGKGGVALDVYGELSAVYTTERIVVEPANKDIEDKGDSTNSDFLGGAFAEFDVWPEGNVSYTGAIHLVPTFFIEVLGFDFDIPIIDYPIDFPLGDQKFVFDPVRVHVPLPDIPTPANNVIDFGSVTVGDRAAQTLTLENNGEAKARVTGFLGATNAEHFTLLSANEYIESMQTGDLNLRFNPKKAGSFSTEVTLVTNDPDNRFITYTLKGTGVGQDLPEYPGGTGGGANGGGSAGPGAQDASGCGCRTVGSSATGSSPLNSSNSAGLLVGLGFAFLIGRRRRFPKANA